MEDKEAKKTKETAKTQAKITVKPLKKQPPKVIHWYVIDDFIHSVINSGLYNVNRLQMANFKALMLKKDKYMVQDEQEFMDEFQKFLKA